ncbi:restriction endonuclease subunit S [Aeromonas caviae]|uniref:restriction endonuclease subunit S n=1 Tax=Aeromonas salmonicida TaxID=645 RepID=UPI000FEB6D65|nr:restriction endonuclease subunit S [Aeromonas caviae]
MKIENLITDHLDLWTAAVRPKSSAGRGSNSKLELTGIKKLRELILELAVRGKLVPQDPNDEPASVLLERIAVEKARLVKEGKIKKPKALPEIGEEEKPFELPEGWEWCRLDELSLTSEAGWSPQCDNTPRKNEQWGVLKVSAVTWGKFLAEENKALPEPLEPKPEYEVLPGDFLISRANTAELVARAVIAPANTPCKLMMSDKIIRFRFSHFVNSSYICLANGSCTSREYYSRVAGGTSSSMKNVSRLQIQNLVIALPPLSEQKRILDNCEKLMALCDQLELRSESQLAAHQTLVEALLATLTDSTDADELAQNWARLSTHFDTLFTTEASIEALKQTILQLAVMGKLVPQDPNDEPASALLARIAAEKAQLVKDKIIKKEKPQPFISEDGRLFELPNGWIWSNIGETFLVTGGLQKTPKRTPVLNHYPYLAVANVQRGRLELDDLKRFEVTSEELERYRLMPGDLMVVEGNGSENEIGRCAIWSGEVQDCLHQNHLIKCRPLSLDLSSWVLQTLNSPFGIAVMKSLAVTSSGLYNLSVGKIRSIAFPLPPLKEQHRIVAKVDGLMALCDQLKSRLQTSQQTHLKLVDSLVEQAF